MRYSTASVVAFAAAAVASPLASPQSPSTPAPAGCSPNYPGKFQIQVVNTTTASKRSIEKRQDGKLEITLANGVLTDAQGRIGNIVANNQFQFDPAPGQAGAIYTSGWSVCKNGSLAIGGDAQFYQCLSGTFYNLYDEKTAAQCYPVFINVIGGSSGAASQLGDGQVTGVASQLSDGQVTATTAASSAAAVTQISDGQVQASTSQSAISQISDGQIQASGAAQPVSQISDGQIQVSTSAAPAYTSAAAAPVSQISDGQVQAPTSTASGPVVTQIGDGQIQSPANGTVSPSGSGTISSPSGTGSPIAYTGAASSLTAASAGLFALFGLALAL